MRVNGADGLAFDSIVASGPNSSMPHAVPTDRKIEEKEREMKKPRQAKKVIKQLSADVDQLRYARIQVCKRHISNKSVNEAILSSIQQLNEIMDFKNEALRNLKESENQQKIEILFNTDMEQGNGNNTTQD